MLLVVLLFVFFGEVFRQGSMKGMNGSSSCQPSYTIKLLLGVMKNNFFQLKCWRDVLISTCGHKLFQALHVPLLNKKKSNFCLNIGGVHGKIAKKNNIFAFSALMQHYNTLINEKCYFSAPSVNLSAVWLPTSLRLSLLDHWLWLTGWAGICIALSWQSSLILLAVPNYHRFLMQRESQDSAYFFFYLQATLSFSSFSYTLQHSALMANKCMGQRNVNRP